MTIDDLKAAGLDPGDVALDIGGGDLALALSVARYLAPGRFTIMLPSNKAFHDMEGAMKAAGLDRNLPRLGLRGGLHDVEEMSPPRFVIVTLPVASGFFVARARAPDPYGT